MIIRLHGMYFTESSMSLTRIHWCPSASVSWIQSPNLRSRPPRNRRHNRPKLVVSMHHPKRFWGLESGKKYPPSPFVDRRIELESQIPKLDIHFPCDLLDVVALLVFFESLYKIAWGSRKKSESGFSNRWFSKLNGSYPMRSVPNESCVSLFFGFTNVFACFDY